MPQFYAPPASFEYRAPKRHRQHSSVAPVFLERLRIRQPFGPRSQPVQFLTQGLLRLMGGRQLRCRFIRLLRRFISLLHSLRTFCRCRYQALFQRLSLFGLRLVFPAAAPVAAAVHLSPWRFQPSAVPAPSSGFSLAALPVGVGHHALSAAASAAAAVHPSPWRLRPLLRQRRLQAFLLLLCL